jgi:iron complex transport system substrate-binding protein
VTRRRNWPGPNIAGGTEIVSVLGLGDQAVGASGLCDYPPEARTKPAVWRSKIDASALTSDQVEEQMRLLLAAGENPSELDQHWMWSRSSDGAPAQDMCYFCQVDAETVGNAVGGMPVPPRVVLL